MKPVVVNYSTAKLLSDNNHDVLVHNAGTGSAWNFADIDWEWLGGPTKFLDIVVVHGIGGMDDLGYTYIWMNSYVDGES